MTVRILLYLGAMGLHRQLFYYRATPPCAWRSVCVFVFLIQGVEPAASERLASTLTLSYDPNVFLRIISEAGSISLTCPGWPGPRSVTQANLELEILLLQPHKQLRRQVCTPGPT